MYKGLNRLSGECTFTLIESYIHNNTEKMFDTYVCDSIGEHRWEPLLLLFIVQR